MTNESEWMTVVDAVKKYRIETLRMLNWIDQGTIRTKGENGFTKVNTRDIETILANAAKPTAATEPAPVADDRAERARANLATGTPWTRAEVRDLKKMFYRTSTEDLAKHFGRSKESIENKAGELRRKNVLKRIEPGYISTTAAAKILGVARDTAADYYRRKCIEGYYRRGAVGGGGASLSLLKSSVVKCAEARRRERAREPVAEQSILNVAAPPAEASLWDEYREKGYLTSPEAADAVGLTRAAMTVRCIQGHVAGATKVFNPHYGNGHGRDMWLIPPKYIESRRAATAPEPTPEPVAACAPDDGVTDRYKSLLEYTNELKRERDSLLRRSFEQADRFSTMRDALNESREKQGVAEQNFETAASQVAGLRIEIAGVAGDRDRLNDQVLDQGKRLTVSQDTITALHNDAITDSAKIADLSRALKTAEKDAKEYQRIAKAEQARANEAVRHVAELRALLAATDEAETSRPAATVEPPRGGLLGFFRGKLST